MATKRVFVPTALHAELTEYTNLVRALRTTRTLDLTTHLLQHAARHKENDADTWTHWPLIDCPVPEWSLEDEIQQLGETVVQQQARAACALDDGEADHDGLAADADADSDLEGMSPTAAKCLILHTGSVLVHILNLMADQRPLAPGSMQNRLWAMNWEDVISLLAVGGAIDPTYVHRLATPPLSILILMRSIIARAEKRLERIYGPSTTKGRQSHRSSFRHGNSPHCTAMERLKSVASAKARFSKLVFIQEDQLLAHPALTRTRRNDTKGHHSRKSGAKSRAVIDTDTDMDA
ncbi:hypothetical protein J3R82DRAFT_3615 [Butyriboletus roseoflavus]|nr:hypothetical protein J3R82DRAFT_3615 [Butyriboletus roseoflavus]